MDSKKLLKSILLVALAFVTNNTVAQTNLALSASENHSGGGLNSTGYGPDNYNDNTYNASCSPTPWGWVSTGGWIEFTWTSAQNIGKMVFYKSNRPMTQCNIQYWDGSSYQTITNYSGSSCEDSVTFTTPVTTTRIRMSNVSGSSNPNHREIFIYGPPCSTAVTQQPVNTTVCEDQDATFSITADDATDYQWQADEGSGFSDINNSSLYSGANSSKLTIKKTPANLNGYQFRCLVEKTVCRDTSTPATLAVNALVKVGTLPVIDTACRDAVKDIQATATGAINSYQWRMSVDDGKNFFDVPTTPPFAHMGHILQIQGVDDTLAGAIFQLNVRGVCDSNSTNTTKMVVVEIPKVATPPNDVNAKHGENVTFQVQSTTPNAKYQWQVATSTNPNNFVNINEGGIYEGARENRLKVYGVSRVQDQYKFRCVVKTKDACLAPGDTSQFALLSVEPPTSVATLPVDENLVVYPNPSNGSEFFIRLDDVTTKGMQYRLTDKLGKTVKTGDINGDKTNVDISALPADIYVVDILDNNQKVVARTKFTRL